MLRKQLTWNGLLEKFKSFKINPGLKNLLVIVQNRTGNCAGITLAQMPVPAGLVFCANESGICAPGIHSHKYQEVTNHDKSNFIGPDFVV